MAQKEIYRLDIKIGVDGDGEAKRKLTATERFAQQSEKRMKMLDKIRASPAVILQDKLSKPLDKIESRLSKFSDFAKTKLIAVATAGALIAGGLGVGSTLNTFMDFEQKMSNVAAISEASKTQLKSLTEQAKELGATTSFSASQAADGMANLASAGFSIKEITAAMPGMLDLAAAGAVDVATASDIAGSALRGFGLQASQAGHVSDVLAKAAADTNAGIEDMGYALKYAAPPAHALGLSLEEVSAAVGVMSNAGIKGEMAGTTLRGALTSLSNPSKEAAKTMSRLGFSAFDSSGKMLPLSQVIGKLQNSLKGLTSQQRQEAIATIFGQESMSGMLTLIEAGQAQLDKLTESFKASDGAAKKMAATQRDNLKGALDELSGAVETLKINVGEKLAPHIRSFAEWLTKKMPEISSSVSGAADGIGATLDKLGKLFDALKSNSELLIPALAGVAAAITTLKTVSMVSSAMAVLLPVFSNIVFAIQAVIGGAATLGEAMAFLMGPVGWVAIAIGALVAVGVYLYRNWDKVKDSAHNLMTKLNQLKDSAINTLKIELGNLKDKIIDLKDNAIETIKKKFEDFKKTLEDNQETIKTTATILGVIFGPALIKTGIQASIAGGQIAIGFIANLVRVGTQAIITAAQLTVSFIGALLKAGVQAVITGGQLAISFTAALIRTGVQAVITAGQIAVSFIASLIRTGIQAGITAAIITGQLIMSLISYAAQGWQTVVSIAAVTFAWIAQKAAMIGSTVAIYAMTAAQWALNVAMSANPIALVVILVVALVGVLIYLYNTSETARTIISAGWSSLQASMGAVLQAIIGIVQGLIAILQGVLQFVVGVFTGNWSMAWQGVQTVFSGVVQVISSAWSGLVSLLTTPVQAIVDILDSAFHNKVATIKNAWNGLKEWLKNPITGTINLIKTGSVSGESVTQHATGGIFTKPHYALFAEESPGEAVIPLNPKRRTSALSIWQETGERLGVNFGENRSINSQPSVERYEERQRFQVAKPQIAVAGGNNINVNVDVENNFDSDTDIDSVVEEASQQFAYKLKEALKNIKK